MLKVNNKINFLLLPVLVFLFTLQVFSQSPEVKQRRDKEHQAIKNYLQDLKNIYPVNPAPKNYSDKVVKNNLSKVTGEEDRKRFLMNGNNISVEIWNYGGIGPGYPGAQLRELLSLVWKDAPYIFQFCPVIGAEVPNAIDNGATKFHIFSDGLYDFDNLREEEGGVKWTWQPLPGYADPDQEFMASNPAFDSDKDGKPDSWPRNWYNETLGEYVWPGYLTLGENNADLETFWVMDDRENREFGNNNQAARYFPFNNDSTRLGLGVQVSGRAFQWANSLAANTIFFQWSITNVSDKDLDSVVFGIYGDPDIGYNGQGSGEPDDDIGLFIPPYNVPNYPPVDNIPVYARSMVYFYDADMTGDLGRPLGYLGCKFLESPGNPDDGIDNDGDGMIDERQDDGIDNDGDWNPETDDVGVDGIPNTGDFGEGDGVPTRGNILPDGTLDPLAPGEPNFEYTDLDEADQIGLTSFNSWIWNEDQIKNDESMWNRTVPQNFSQIELNNDIVFIFGSGYISLKKGETKRISMAFLFGENLNDLLVTAETVQEIYNKNYRFFKPPALPVVTAVPGDKKVTLYWDNSSEQSLDPITGNDFEGYVIYRSTRPDFSDVQKITDGHGASFLYEPLRDLNGFEAKWDLDNEWRGYHPVAYQGRGLHYYLGDNTGLRHSFVDTNNVINGQKYYYAVVAYDHGDSLGIPPSETTKKISVDPITGTEIFDVNTVAVIPGPRASGYVSPQITNMDITHSSGIGNGDFNFKILNDLDIQDNVYTITFSDSLYLSDTVIAGKNYSIRGNKPFTESFFLFDLKFTSLSNSNIINDQTLQVRGKDGTVYQQNVDYVIDFTEGKIRRLNNNMPNNSEYIITYNYYSVYQSQALNNEDSNPVFDGILFTLKDNPAIEFNAEKSGWISGDVDIPFNVAISSLGSRKMLYPADYLITFSDQNEYTALKNIQGQGLVPFPVNFKVEEITPNRINQQMVVFLNEKAKNDTAFTRGDGIIIFKPGSTGTSTDTLTWEITLNPVSEGDSVYPGSGDVLKIVTNRPYTEADTIKLTTKAASVNQTAGKSLLDNIYVVPNPYVGANVLEPDNKLTTQNRGERRIYFENLPMRCTIRIYTITGELVATLEHDEGFDNGREYWNLLNSDGFSVAYGVYIAHIEAPGIGEKLVKFALIK